MARNVIHLLASDRRHIRELFLRALRGRGSRDAHRHELVAALQAHLWASRDEVHAFVVSRRPASHEDVDALAGACDDLLAGASALTDGGGGAARDDHVRELRGRYEDYVRREQHLLDGLSDAVEVPRLRELGGAYCRRRDGHARSRHALAGRVPRRLDMPRADLYEQARRARIPGRSAMSREELIAALTGRAGGGAVGSP